MGQKVHPIGIRLGIVKDWSSKWYADTQTFPVYVKQDHEVRVYIKNKLNDDEMEKFRKVFFVPLKEKDVEKEK